MTEEGAQSLTQLIRGMTKSEDGSVMEATVISTDPLRVQATNDDKLILSAASLTVPQRLTDHTEEITVSWNTENTGGGSGDAAFAPHGHILSGRKTVLIHGGLTEGDTVYLLRYNNGKKYYILDRRG